jgi:uncharacterized protein (TIGR00645 family)
MPTGIKHIFERFLFASRWLMVPFYLGLVIALAGLLVVFVHELIEHLPLLLEATVSSTTLWILSLIDLSLVGNLILIVIFAGYQNFIARTHAQDHPDWPSWVDAIGFSGTNLKLIGSIAAISSIYLLEIFLKPEKLDPTSIGWLLAIQGMILISGVLLVVMDYIAAHTGEGH